MRWIALSLALGLLPTTASAVDLYVEGAIGGTFIHDLETDTVTVTDGQNTATGSAELTFDPSLYFGVEAGVGAFMQFIPGIRLAASWDRVEAELDEVELSGTVNGTPGSITLDASDFESSIDVYSANVYFDLNPDWQEITPYGGIGVGIADGEDFDDEEWAFSATAGLKYWPHENIGIGAKYKFITINGPDTGIAGVKYDDIYSHTFGATLTLRLRTP